VLSWQPADVPGRSACIPKYQIEVQDPPSIGTWTQWANNITRTTYTMSGLKPDRDYLFRVKAVVDGNTSEPTMPVYLFRRSGKMLFHIY